MNRMTEVKRFSLVKPSTDTHFHIDFDWWRQNENDWHVHLRSSLCPQHQSMFSDWKDTFIDWIDPQTAEVVQMDGLQQVLMTHCAKEPDFLTAHTMLVDGVFRALLVQGNKPMSSRELGERLGKSPDIILKTISGPRVYKGIRPVLD
jgi:hypothetical protein